MVDSWLMSATEYIAIDNTLLQAGVHVDRRSGMACPDQLAGHAKLKSGQHLSSANFVIYHLYSLLLGRWLGSIR